MRALLSKKEQQLLQLVELIQREKIYTYNYLETQLEINTRTLNNLIDEFNIQCAPLQICRKERGEITILRTKNYSIEYCFQKILSDSIEFDILERLFFISSMTMEELAHATYLSPATLRRKINKMNEVLVNEGFRIELPKMKIVGDEKKICNFIIQYILEKYNDGKEFF